MSRSQPTPKIRLYVEAPLASGAAVDATDAQAHYLLHVMRLGPGASVLLFNGQDGEWRATVSSPAKRRIVVTAEEQTRAQAREPDVWLAFAPVKRMELTVEKAVEIGAAKLLPVMTRHTDITRVNTARLRATAIEAAEQCRRLSVPEVCAPSDFDAFTAGWSSSRSLYFLDETGGGEAIAPLLAAAGGGPCAFLVGPEGGFAPSELETLRQMRSVRGVTLGPRILRAETAALAALACWQALQGDWAVTQA